MSLLAEPEARQSPVFLGLYALAVAGGAAGYIPFLSLLLPLRVMALDPGGAVAALAIITFTGAVAASIGNIAFGWLSDITGNRRGWIAGGLALTCALLIAMTEARGVPMLVAMVVAWQLGLNMMLGPLGAWAGDCVPDGQKGLLGGLLAFAPAFGALVGTLITIGGLAGPDGRLVIVAVIVAFTVLPVLVFGKPRPMPHLIPRATGPGPVLPIDLRRMASVKMWVARLLVQVAEAALLAYLLFWLVSLDARINEGFVARVFSFVLAAAVPAALVAGALSDRLGRPIAPLFICAFVASGGLVAMALAGSIVPAVAGYIVFGLAASVFIALHASQTLRVLPRPERRGRDLGLFNLTNTLPQVVMPVLAVAVIPRYGFGALFLSLAVLVAGAGAILATMPAAVRRR